LYRRLSAVKTRKRNIDIVVASLVVHCCAVKKNVIFTSQLHDVADVQFTAEKERTLEFFAVYSKVGYNHGNSVPKIVIMIFLTIAVSVATCERSFSKLKLIKNYLRYSMSTMRLRNPAILSIEQQLTD